MPACRTSCRAGSRHSGRRHGAYIDSLIAGRQFAPLPQTGRREALERRAAEEGAQPLLDELRAVDPERAARLSVSDVKKRIVRALEIWQETGRTMTDFDRESRAIPPRYRPLWLGLHFPERARSSMPASICAWS